LQIIGAQKKPLSVLKQLMTPLPQALINVDVRIKPELIHMSEIQRVIKSVESRLAGHGRVLVRYSGTQPQCRVMVEGPTQGETERFCLEIADEIRAQIGP